MFNEVTINFLNLLIEEYSNLCIQEKKSIEDVNLYQNLLNIIKNECGYCYKLSRDIEDAIRNMNNGVYRDIDIIEIESDMLYIKFIINFNNNKKL